MEEDAAKLRTHDDPAMTAASFQKPRVAWGSMGQTWVAFPNSAIRGGVERESFLLPGDTALRFGGLARHKLGLENV
jgi:hypothetical protein